MSGGLEYKFSPSQIDTFDESRGGCNRKWAWARIGKIKAPQHPSAALGERIHAQLERYLLTGETPRHFHADGSPDETGAMCEPSLEFLPAPGTCIVEGKRSITDTPPDKGLFSFMSPRTGFIYNGRIDWERRLPADLAHLFGYEDPENWAEVGDHKSTGNLDFMKTPQSLLEDPQGVIYAVKAMADYMVPHVRLHWNYVPTKIAPRSLPVYQEVHSKGVAEQFRRIEGVAERMAKILDSTDPDGILNVAPNTDACGAYGGCPYKHKCQISPFQTLRFRELPEQPQPKEDSVDLVEQMRARKAALVAKQNGEGAAPPPGPAATPETPPPPPPPALGAAQEMTAAGSSVVQSLAAAAGTTVQTPFGAGVQEGPALTGADAQNLAARTEAAVAPGAINPPEASAPKNAVELDAAESAGKAPATEKKSTSSRVKKPAAAAAETPAATAPVAGAPAGVLGFLFLDCMPTKGVPFVDAAALVAQANADTVEAWNRAHPDQRVSDYRGIDYKGGGFLAARAVELVKAGPGVNLVLNTGTPEGKLLQNPLSAIAGAVIKGTVS